MDKQVVKLLEDIKKLMILQIMKGSNPSTSDEIGEVLGVTGRAIRNVATTTKKKVKKNKK
ncbi:hypothetical protein KC866_03865 [Patescibacteria group bacterium]|nr:hypothetical protein [Patescibacteria group bacterium]